MDIERSRWTEILPEPWQTDTCLGDWHYKRSIFEKHEYKTAAVVIPLLIDVVSKNGNLLMSVPVRGDGTIDADEVAFLRAMASWLPQHGEAVFGTRPYTVYGEGPPEPIEQNFSEKVRPHTAKDIRFTTRAGLLYAFVLDGPGDGVVRVKTLRRGGEHALARPVEKVELIGASGTLKFEQTEEAAGGADAGGAAEPVCVCAADCDGLTMAGCARLSALSQIVWRDFFLRFDQLE